MIIKYEMKNNVFLSTPCPHNYNPVNVSFNKENQKVMVASVICQQHCQYFIEHNSKEQYVICRKD